jgi:myo-inositol-1(or 4)-monophosphatase
MDVREFIEKILRESGEVVRQSFGEIVPSTKKLEKTQIVTEVDIASERLLIERIIKEFPNSGIIAEESGFILSKDTTYWIIDPIDGTSNFANAIPWFGVMVAFVIDHSVTDSGIYLPMSGETYSATLNKGAYKNGIKIQPPRTVSLSESLVSLCFSSDETLIQKEGKLFTTLSPHVLNIRSTNSAYDYAYAADGKFAATINLTNKIWDVAPVSLIAKESGMNVYDSEGNPLHFALTDETYEKNYTLIISNPSISEELLQLIS